MTKRCQQSFQELLRERNGQFFKFIWMNMNKCWHLFDFLAINMWNNFKLAFWFEIWHILCKEARLRCIMGNRKLWENGHRNCWECIIYNVIIFSCFFELVETAIVRFKKKTDFEQCYTKVVHHNCVTDHIGGCYIQFLFTLIIALYYSVLSWFFLTTSPLQLACRGPLDFLPVLVNDFVVLAWTLAHWTYNALTLKL